YLEARIDVRGRGWRRDVLIGAGRALDRWGLRTGRTASRALGYSRALAQIDGELSEEQAQEDTARATRRFARRQESWFRRDPRVRWLPYDVPELLVLAQSR